MGYKARRYLTTIGIALNMLTCAVFCPGAMRRESISGYVGRNAAMGKRAFILAEKLIDKLHPHEPNHCRETAICENRSRFYGTYG